eukprot:538456_1
MDFNILDTNNSRYEIVGSKVVKLDLNYVDKAREHPIFIKAREFYLHHQWKEAKKEYKKLLAINPNNATYHHSYSCILSRFRGQSISQSLVEAQKHTAIATELEPENVHMRLSNIQFLMALEQHPLVHKQFQIIFDQLFGNNNAKLHVTKIAAAFEKYSRLLFDSGQYEEAIKYLENACAIRKKFDQTIQQQTIQNLANMYLRTEQIEKSLHFISMMQRNNKTIWEEFQSELTNDNQPWINCKAEIHLLTGEYQEAYSLFKRYLKKVRLANQMHSKLRVYINLIKCCIELNKVEEAVTFDNELFVMCTESPEILNLTCNQNVSWERAFLMSYFLIKKGGLENAMMAVEQMERVSQNNLEINQNMGSSMPESHFYLGLAYRNLVQYANNQTYELCFMDKAKASLFQAAHLRPKQTEFIWEFALTLFEGKELYLCKQYATKAWKRCKEIKHIASMYPKMKKKWKKQQKLIKCCHCGKHKYLISENSADKLKVCKGCYASYYCDKECQKMHWNRSHRSKCCKIWIERHAALLKPAETLTQFIPLNDLTSKYASFFESIPQFR